ncbi:MAG: hypothetical protein JSV05_05020 [Candidatus Bathyarchaeota archaeon]|nr:MAG: hypothetical protein JSV05_05020 [Candidatus Bathyarchaeota archaeon]
MAEIVVSKRTFLIGLVLGILASTAISVTFVILVYPSLLPKGWHEVTFFSGTFQEYDSETLEKFHISSNHWRLKWNTDLHKNPENAEFHVFVIEWINVRPYFHQAAPITPESRVGSFWIDYGLEYFIGPGQKQVEVAGATVNYTIIIEAYY